MLTADVHYNLCALIDAYCKATNRRETTISNLFYGNSKFFPQFRRGEASLSVKKLDEIVEAFRETWPQGTPWPALRTLSMDAAPPKPSRKSRG